MLMHEAIYAYAKYLKETGANKEEVSKVEQAAANAEIAHNYFTDNGFREQLENFVFDESYHQKSYMPI